MFLKPRHKPVQHKYLAVNAASHYYWQIWTIVADISVQKQEKHLLITTDEFKA